MCDYADGFCDVWRETWRRARKEHRCIACREVIRAGDRYHVTKWVFDGSAGTEKHCARCWSIYAEISARAERGTYVDVRLDCGERWEDNFGDLPPDVASLAFLTPDEAQALATTEPTHA